MTGQERTADAVTTAGAVDVPAEGSDPVGAKGLPFAAVLGLIAGLAVFATSQTHLRDIDVFWHVLAGRELLAGVAPDHVGRTWSFAPDPQHWTSTQWLAEVLFAWIHDVAGWAGLAAFRVLTAAAAIAILALTTLRGRSRAVAGFPFLLATAMLAFVSQERPAQFTLIGSAVLGGVLVAGLTRHRLPRWYLLLPATTLWANLHGGWVLVPTVLLLVAAGVALDCGVRAPVVRHAALLAVGAAVAGCLTPSGLSGLMAPVRFSEAAALIKEWAPVEPTSTLGWLTLAMLALFLIGWSGAQRLPRSEGLVVLLLLCFTWMAYRNLAPGLAMLAPLAAHGLCRGFPEIGRPEPRWSVPVGAVLAVLLTVLGVASVAVVPNLPTGSQPLALAQRIATLPPGQRVLNDYNTSGAVLYFGGSGTMVAIDGRSDRYGADYIRDYVDLTQLEGDDWEQLLDTLQPTAALLDKDAPLARLLVTERGWQQLGPVDADHVLLVPPAAGKSAGSAPAQG